MKVIGISGSPINNSNTDRGVTAVLEATGAETEFIKLIDYTVAPCKGCLGCLKTNRCVIKDDGIELAQKVKDADALVVGGFTPYSTLDSRTKAFLERLYPLRHKYGFLVGKPVASVITTGVPEGVEGMPPAGEMGAKAIQFFAMEEGMNYVGHVVIEGNVPCIKCGHHKECAVDGIEMIYGPGATVESVGIHSFEDQEAAFLGASDLGQKIGSVLNAEGSDKG